MGGGEEGVRVQGRRESIKDSLCSMRKGKKRSFFPGKKKRAVPRYAAPGVGDRIQFRTIPKVYPPGVRCGAKKHRTHENKKEELGAG